MPITTPRVGELLDTELAKSLARLVGVDVGTLRQGLERLRLDGYRIVRRLGDGR